MIAECVDCARLDEPSARQGMRNKEQNIAGVNSAKEWDVKDFNAMRSALCPMQV